MLRASIAAALFCATAFARPAPIRRAVPNLTVKVSVADGIINSTTDGHLQILFAPAGTDPLEDTDVTSTPDYFFGQNVFGFASGSSATLSGGNNDSTDLGVWGYPNTSLDTLEPGEYTVQAFLNIYETATRGDGSVVSLRFPCGDGALPIEGYGTPYSEAINVTITGAPQELALELDSITEAEEFTGSEIGGCYQGNYEDEDFLKYIKIRSTLLSDWWGRDMYVGANVLIPFGYNRDDIKTRYPVVYNQGHWPANRGPFTYSSATAPAFRYAWNNGTIPGTNTTEERETPKMIIVTIRHETPYYDDSYAVNTANLGPYGDAINDELIPYIDSQFNTIAEPYARIQQGGSTGGWESIASVIFRPDLFGACFSSYPDSLDFHRHQDIPLYDAPNAYVRENGSFIPSIRTCEDGPEEILASTWQENHWELTHGTNTRSYLQWDVWDVVFGAQGLNSYPLVPWDKVTGEIYPAAVAYWREFDLSYHVTSNWEKLNLGEVLKNRLFVYVGTCDDYYLNEGVQLFQEAVEAKGGPGWANFTYIEGAPHGGNYQRRETWNYLEFLASWFEDHAPGGKTPLSSAVTTSAARGNIWEEVIALGGHEAAVARQAPPVVKGTTASVGKWDPGMVLVAQWLVDGKAVGEPFAVKEGEEVSFKGYVKGCLTIAVTGSKRGYEMETRTSAA
jgi:hypothetical protein